MDHFAKLFTFPLHQVLVEMSFDEHEDMYCLCHRSQVNGVAIDMKLWFSEEADARAKLRDYSEAQAQKILNQMKAVHKSTTEEGEKAEEKNYWAVYQSFVENDQPRDLLIDIVAAENEAAAIDLVLQKYTIEAQREFVKGYLSASRTTGGISNSNEIFCKRNRKKLGVWLTGGANG